MPPDEVRQGMIGLGPRAGGRIAKADQVVGRRIAKLFLRGSQRSTSGAMEATVGAFSGPASGAMSGPSRSKRI